MGETQGQQASTLYGPCEDPDMKTDVYGGGGGPFLF
jgi:hypothetical protein